MLAHHDGFDAGIALADFLHREAEFKARTHPFDVVHFVAENFAGQFLAVGRGGDGNNGVRMHVIHKLRGDEAVERRVNGGGAGIQIEGAMIIRADHVVFGLGLEAFIRASGVALLHADQLGLIERRKIFAGAGAQVAAGAFDPKDLDVLAGERIALGDFGRGIAAAGVSDALVAAEFV